MIVKTRETAQGTEYWDNKAKKILFVPTGEKPNFKVTESPKSMLGNVKDEKSKALEDMTIKELKEYAAELDVEIPTNITKKEDIIKLLSDAE